MPEKKYKGRKAYLNDFKKNAQGEYEYRGNLYEWRGSEAEHRKELAVLWGLCVGMLIALITAVSLDAPGTFNCIYVIFPAAISLIFGISVAWGLWRLSVGGNPMRGYIYEATIGALPLRSLGTMAAAVVGIAGELFYLLRNGAGEKIFGAVILLLTEVAALFCVWLIRKKIMVISEKMNKMSNEN